MGLIHRQSPGSWQDCLVVHYLWPVKVTPSTLPPRYFSGWTAHEILAQLRECRGENPTARRNWLGRVWVSCTSFIALVRLVWDFRARIPNQAPSTAQMWRKETPMRNNCMWQHVIKNELKPSHSFSVLIKSTHSQEWWQHHEILGLHSVRLWTLLSSLISNQGAPRQMKTESVQEEMCKLAGSPVFLQHITSINVPQALFNGDTAHSKTQSIYLFCR